MAETARDWTPDLGLHWHPAQNLVQHGGFWVACGHEVIVAVVADEVGRDLIPDDAVMMPATWTLAAPFWAWKWRR